MACVGGQKGSGDNVRQNRAAGNCCGRRSGKLAGTRDSDLTTAVAYAPNVLPLAARHGARRRGHVHRALLVCSVLYSTLYLLYFFSLELPNATVPGTPGRKFSRLDVWQLSVPGLVPGLRPLAVQALAKFTNVSGIMQRLPVFGTSALVLLAAVGLGYLVLFACRLVSSPARMRRSTRAGTDAKVREPSRHSDRNVEVSLSVAEMIVFAYGLGLAGLSLTTLLLGLAAWLGRAAAAAVVVPLSVAGAGVLLALCSPRKVAKLHSGSGNSQTYCDGDEGGRSQLKEAAVGSATRWAVLVVAALFALIMTFGAALPATDFDAREYHLQGPKEFYLSGRIGFVPHNVYCNMPFGTEMITLLAMCLYGDWWWGALAGQVVLATYGLAGSLACYCIGLRLFSPLAGWLAACVYISTPWVYRLAIIPYAEGALCFYTAAALLAVVLAFQCRPSSSRLWLVAGLLAGAAAGCKYTSLNSTVAPFLLTALIAAATTPRSGKAQAAKGTKEVKTPGEAIQPAESSSMVEHSQCHVVDTAAGRKRRAAPVVAFLFGVVLACGPWLVKNAVLAGNPMYPLLYRVFGGRNWTPEKNAKWEWGHRVPLFVLFGWQRPPEGKEARPDDPQHGITLGLLLRHFRDVTVQADWLSPLLFAFAPLALLGARRHAALPLILLTCYLFFEWWLLTHRLDRFWLPLLPAVAVLAGAGLSWSSVQAWRLFTLLVVALAVFYNFSYCTSALCGYNDYTVELNPLAGDPTAGYKNPVNWMNQQLPRRAHVLAVGAADLFHLRRRLTYNTVFDDCVFELICRGRNNEQIRGELARRGVTHVYVSWAEVARYRATYGYTEFITPELFRRLSAGPNPVLRRMMYWGQEVEVSNRRAAAGELYLVLREPPR